MKDSELTYEEHKKAKEKKKGYNNKDLMKRPVKDTKDK